jgi:hypothetical protein
MYPQRDHTLNTMYGSYAFVDLTNRAHGSKSGLLGPTFSPIKTDMCKMRFYYYLFGNNAARLSVYYRDAVGDVYYQLWRVQDIQTQFWERAEMTVSMTSRPVQIVIEAEARNNTKLGSVVAVDDVSFTDQCIPYAGDLPVLLTSTTASPCGPDGYQCADGKCIIKSQLCDFYPNCANNEDESNCGTCSFENGTCGWYVSHLVLLLAFMSRLCKIQSMIKLKDSKFY